MKDGNKVYIKPAKEGFFKKEMETIDVAFLAVHGTNGEDGALQGYMEMLKLPYTSSDVLGSAIGQDKAIMKEILMYEGIEIVDKVCTTAEPTDGNGTIPAENQPVINTVTIRAE